MPQEIRKTRRRLPESAKPYQFKPGQSGNPEGGRAHNPVKKAMKALTIKNFQLIVKAVCVGNLNELERIAKDPKTPALQVGVAIALGNAIRAGDFATLRTIISDVIGKVPDEIKVMSENKNLNLNVNAEVDRSKLKEAVQKLLADV